ncbi:unnamed protein product [Linum trigynum]|uniref:Uncharacterized protein n=1 Tax=Linum trigynum TaxID=586398 RepID=A0AAV2GBP1_9ROSI
MENVAGAKKLVEGSTEAKQPRNCSKETSPAIIIKHREFDEQRDNLFHSRCEINGKIASLVIDGGSCANLISTYAVEKLELKTQKHPKPYHLTWLNEHGDLKVNKQVQIEFSLGNYSDSVLCDVVPMQNADILLGRPWQFDRRVIHDGWENSYTLKHDGKKIKLKPMSPDDVYADLKTMEERMNEGKGVKAQLWVQRNIGFNFMSFRKPRNEGFSLESTDQNDPCSAQKIPCFALITQNTEKPRHFDKFQDESSKPDGSEVLLEGEGILISEADDSAIPEDAQIEPLTRAAELCSSTTMVQSRREVQLVGATGATLTSTTNAHTSQIFPRNSSIELIDSNAALIANPNLEKLALKRVEYEAKTHEWVGATTAESMSIGSSESKGGTLRSCGIVQFATATPESKTPNLGFLNRNVKNNKGEKRESVSGFERDLICSNAWSRFLAAKGWFRCADISTKLQESQFPNFASWSPETGFNSPVSGDFKVLSGGKFGGNELERLRRRRGMEGVGIIPWSQFEPDGCEKLERKGVSKKAPNLEPSPEFLPAPASGILSSESGNLKSCVLGLFDRTDCLGKVHWSPKNLLKLKSWRTEANLRAEEEFDVQNFLPKSVFGQSSFDPIWDQFCCNFAKRSEQALRAKLFEEGEPDMIQIGHFYKSQLLAKEAIKVGKKNGRIWLSQIRVQGTYFGGMVLAIGLVEIQF